MCHQNDLMPSKLQFNLNCNIRLNKTKVFCDKAENFLNKIKNNCLKSSMIIVYIHSEIHT